MRKIKKTGFKYYFCDCNCEENSFKDIRKAIDHYDNCSNCKKIIHKFIYEQVFDDKGRICYPYGKNG